MHPAVLLTEAIRCEVVPASQMPPRPPAACLPSGVASLDALTEGLPRGALTEIFGPASSGRTSLLLAILAQATARGEICALVDAADSFDPASAQAAGVHLKRVLWVRCRKNVSSFTFHVSGQEGSRETRNANRETSCGVENALKATDFLLQAGGFGLLVIDLASVPPATARRVPLTSWFRFRRAVENTPTALLALEEEPFAKSAAGLVLKMKSSVVGRRSSAKALPSHARLLTATEISIEVVRAVADRKPPARAVSFQTRAQWAG
jgi:recA bacterial DNA recombination protein